ncbi:MAG: 50S ribosomal protein L9 [Micrococcaceae bacterium]
MAKIILIKDVDGLGTAGDLVDVKGGYARNYLLPQGYAITWTKDAEKSVESLRTSREERRKQEVKDAKSVAQDLKDKTIKIPVKTGENGKLFGSVGSAHLTDAISDAGIADLDRKKVEILDTVKETGTYKAKVRLHDDVESEFEFNVVEEETE